MKGKHLGEVASLILTIVGMTEKTNAVEIDELLQYILERKVHAGVRYNVMKRLEEEGMLTTDREVLERIDPRMRISYKLSEKGQLQYETEQKARYRLQMIATRRFKKRVY